LEFERASPLISALTQLGAIRIRGHVMQGTPAHTPPTPQFSTLLRDNVIRFTVGLFIFTLLFAIGTVARIDAAVPHIVVWVAGLLGFGSIIAFLFLIDHSARLLRPVSIVWRVGEQGLAVIESVYPNSIRENEIDLVRF
jgi:uncharacterized membrane protein